MLILTRFQDYYFEILTSARMSVAFLLVGLLTWDVGLSSSSSSLSLLSLNLFLILWAPKYVLTFSKNNTLKKEQNTRGIYLYVAAVCRINDM